MLCPPFLLYENDGCLLCDIIHFFVNASLHEREILYLSIEEIPLPRNNHEAQKKCKPTLKKNAIYSKIIIKKAPEDMKKNHESEIQKLNF